MRCIRPKLGYMRLKLNYIRPKLGYMGPMLRYIGSMLSHIGSMYTGMLSHIVPCTQDVEVHRPAGTHKDSRKLSRAKSFYCVSVHTWISTS